MDLYIHSPIRLHGVALNSLSTGITLPLLLLLLLLFLRVRRSSRQVGPTHNWQVHFDPGVATVGQRAQVNLMCCVKNICEGLSSTDIDIDHYVGNRELLTQHRDTGNLIFFVSLPAQGMT
jgi:hypothetical protein